MSPSYFIDLISFNIYFLSYLFIPFPFRPSYSRVDLFIPRYISHLLIRLYHSGTRSALLLFSLCFFFFLIFLHCSCLVFATNNKASPVFVSRLKPFEIIRTSPYDQHQVRADPLHARATAHFANRQEACCPSQRDIRQKAKGRIAKSSHTFYHSFSFHLDNIEYDPSEEQCQSTAHGIHFLYQRMVSILQ